MGKVITLHLKWDQLEAAPPEHWDDGRVSPHTDLQNIKRVKICL